MGKFETKMFRERPILPEVKTEIHSFMKQHLINSNNVSLQYNAIGSASWETIPSEKIITTNSINVVGSNLQAYATRPNGGLGIHWNLHVGEDENYKCLFLCVEPVLAWSGCVFSRESFFRSFLSPLHSLNCTLKLLLSSLSPKKTYFHISEEQEKSLRSHYISLVFGTCSSPLLLPTLPFGLVA